MKLFKLKKTLIGSILGSFLVLGAAGVASAQDFNEEYREWQMAQRRAQEEYRDYLRTRSRRDYRDWQQAQRIAQREYNDYLRVSRGGGNVVFTPNMSGRRFYRVYRNGSSYRVDERGADLLRQAVNNGYQQGFRQGQLDARYGRGMNFYDDNIYRMGNFGYRSYVDQNQYQYYFQQGFQRGYQDGYTNQSRYGYRTGSSFNILGTVLNSILNLALDNQ